MASRNYLVQPAILQMEKLRSERARSLSKVTQHLEGGRAQPLPTARSCLPELLWGPAKG